MSDQRYLLAIDAGTTAIKVVLFSQAGEMVAEATQEYSLITLGEEMIEMEPDTYWEACVTGIRSVLKEVDPTAVAALGISSQGETLIPINSQGKALRRAIVWLDNRASEEAKEIADKIDLDTFYQVSGSPEIVPCWPACKILWLKKNEPHIFEQTDKFLLLGDYLAYRLTGVAATGGSQSTSAGYFDVRSHQWWPEMLELIGLTKAKLPKLCAAGEPVGTITPQASAEIGLTTKTVICAAAMDQAAAAVGAGNIQPGTCTAMIGTALALGATVPEPTYDPQKRLPCYVHAAPDRWLLLPYCQTSAVVLKWFRDEFCQEEMESARQAGEDPYDRLTAMAQKVEPGSAGLLLLPHFTGSTSPRFSPQAKGVFFGISFNHTKSHFLRATMESVAFMLRENVELLNSLGVEVEEVRALGGAAKSPFWLQMMADVLGRPVVTMKCQEAACLGAALLAGAGAGIYPSLEEAVHSIVATRSRFAPDTKASQTYEKHYQHFLKTSSVLLDLCEQTG